ncbi:MAG: ComEC/Rec2 family competence protein [bacterium]|nr:ComEC/Rec2 family competence protein [bacterium]
MKWEKNLIVFCLGFVIGIAFAYSFQNMNPVLFSGIGLAAIVFLVFLIISLKQHNKYQYVPRKFLNPAWIAGAFAIAILVFIFHNRLPEKNHISYCAEYRPKRTITLEGVVVDEPSIQRDKTTIRLRPYLVEKDGEKYEVAGNGKVEIYIYPDNKYYGQLYYCDKFRVTGDLIKPRPAENPGGFDYANFLRSTNIYAQMFVRGEDSEIQKIGKVNGNPVVKFALKLKEKMLLTIRKTMPYPESAFLGGVTLGLRYGIRKMYLTEEADTLIEDEFKWSGVNHVLAVSGLHVTIITVMFWGIFVLLKLPRKVYPFIIIFFLLLFTIITGARPSTIRASIMNSIILATYAITKSGLRSSIITGIAAAAALILIFTPRVITEASFTLSFGAVLSLVLITPPVMEILNNQLVGYRFIGGIVITVLFTAMVILLQNKFFGILWLSIFVLCSVIIWIIFAKLQKASPMLGFSFRRVPNAISGFIGAQFAIQIGMMLPLSALYFGRYPIAGAYANFIAIPLIGINVQLGILAGVFGLIPKIGLPVALLLNAGNWLFCKFFLWLAHLATLIFPYPFVVKPSGTVIVIYYILLGGFIWKDFILGNLKKYYFNLVVYFKDYPKKAKTYLTAVIAGIILIILLPLFLIKPYQSELEILFFSVGRSNAILVRTPSSKNFLIDAGLHYKYIRDGLTQEWDVAEKTIIPTLLKMNIKTLDGVVVTNLSRENISGMHTIIKHMNVKHVYLPLDTKIFHADLTYDKFLDLLNSDYYKKNKDKWWVQEYYDQYISLLKLIREMEIPSSSLKYGDYLVHEFKKSGKLVKELEIYCLNPVDSTFTGARDEITDKSIVLNITYGIKTDKNSKEFLKKNTFILLSDVGKTIQENLVKNAVVSKTDVITVPYKGEKRAFHRDFLKLTLPIDAVVQFDARGRNEYKEEDLIQFIYPEYESLNIQLLRTDEVGAVIYQSNGSKIKRKTMIKD